MDFDYTILNSGERDALWCLFYHGPTTDGDIPSKTDRSRLVSLGLAQRGYGYSWLTEAGVKCAILLGMDLRKDKCLRELSKPIKVQFSEGRHGEILSHIFLDSTSTHG